MNTEHYSIKKAALLNASSRYLAVVLQIIYMSIISRILTPEEFGIVAVVNVFIVFFQLFADMGFGTAVIQNKGLTKEDINQIFTCTIYIGIVLMLFFLGLSYIIADVYNNDIYVPLGIMLSFSLLYNSFNMIPNSVMLKEKKFIAIAIRTIVVTLVSYSFATILAIWGLGVYVLAANSVFMALALFIWNEISTKLSFRWKIKLSTLRKVWSYSLFQFSSQVLNYFNRNLDTLLIGKYLSVSDLGYYNKAYTLIGYPVAYLPGVITPVLHPILSEHQDDKDYIYNRYFNLLEFLSILGCFGAAFCFFAGREIVLLAFGNQWEPSIIPFQLLSISLGMQILTNTIAPIYQSIGNTKLLFKSTIITTILIVTSIFIGVRLGSILSVAICVSLAYIVNFVVSFWIMITKGFQKSFFQFVKFFRYEIVFFIVLIVIAVFWTFEFERLVISFIIKLGVYIVVYGLLLWVTKQHKVLKEFIKKGD